MTFTFERGLIVVLLAALLLLLGGFFWLLTRPSPSTIDPAVVSCRLGK